MKNDALRQQIIEILPRLRKFAYSLTGTKADADDLLQATVERLLRRPVPEDIDLLKWAFRVCKNMWIDEIRAQNVRTRAADSLSRESGDDVDGEKSVMATMALNEVNHAMNQLPDEQRAALALVCLEGCSYAEAAEALGSPVGTILSRVSRARASLNAIFNDGTKANTSTKSTSATEDEA